jgi:HD superfamily phosphohydrolase
MSKTKRRRINPTTIFDPVHREYELPPELIDIINTPIFQRLRRLRQLSTAHYVWLGATHTRFEHSISVAYLAGTMAKNLQRKQPELNITPRQILLVQFAGLLHDVGHGPFSHLFDDVFLKDDKSAMAHHEMRSVTIVARLLSESSFEYSPEEIAFVQSLIAPTKGQDGFMYHIVANQVNHLDVDKMEYIKRDARACGLSQGGFDTDTRRILNNARVIDGVICYNHKVYEDIYNLFQTRYRLHTTVYRHPAVVATHHMVSDALVASGLPLRESINDIDSFCKYDDTIIDTLRNSTLSKTTREIIHRIDTRDLYKVVVTCKRSKPWLKNPTVHDLLAIANKDALAWLVKHEIMHAIYHMEKNKPSFGHPNSDEPCANYIKLCRLQQLGKKINSRIPLEKGCVSANEIERFILNMTKHTVLSKPYKERPVPVGHQASEDKFPVESGGVLSRVQSCVVTNEGVFIHISHVLAHKEDNSDDKFQKMSKVIPPDRIVIECSCVGFTGKADGHPMDSLRFYDNSSPTKSFSVKRTSVSTLLAARYCEYWTQIIVKDSKYADSAVTAFDAWKASI